MRFPEYAAWVRRQIAQLGYERDYEFAAAVGVKAATVSRWIRGMTPPTAKNIEALVALTGTPGDDIRRMVGILAPDGTDVPRRTASPAEKLRAAIILAQEAERQVRLDEGARVRIPIYTVREVAAVVAVMRGEGELTPDDLTEYVRPALVEGLSAVAIRVVGPGLASTVQAGEYSILAREEDWSRVEPGQVVWALVGDELVIATIGEDGATLVRPDLPDVLIDDRAKLLGRRLARVIED